MKFIILTTLLLSAIQCLGQAIQDESYFDESFWEFRAKLEYSIAQKDLDLFTSLLADTVYESKDGCGAPGCSKAEFIHSYFTQNNSLHADKRWKEIQTVVRFGFSRYVSHTTVKSPVLHDTITYQAPSYLKNINRDKEVFILGEKVNIRENPSIHSKIIRQASFEVLKCDCSIFTTKDSTYVKADDIWWLEVYWDGSMKGYISADLTSYDIIKEMSISRVNGEWKIISYSHAPGC